LTDFGVARANERITKTRTGELKGKLPYMSPEQANAEELDRRSDVFSMGIVLVEMFTNRRLFKNGSHMDTIRQLLMQPIPRLRERMPDAPVELDVLCGRALAKDRNERFSTAADFALALENVARKLGLLASPRDVAESIQKLVGPVLAERAAQAAEAQSEVISAVIERPPPVAPHTVLLEHALVPFAETMSVPFAALANAPNSSPSAFPSESSSSITRRPSSRPTVTIPLVLAAILASSAGTLAIVDARASNHDAPQPLQPVPMTAINPPATSVGVAPVVSSSPPVSFTSVSSASAEPKRKASFVSAPRHPVSAGPQKHEVNAKRDNSEFGPGRD